jgi:CIC family chloride channel protein
LVGGNRYLGALVTECFRRATDLLHFLFTGSEATIITSFEGLPLWQRFFVPVIGAVLAGLTLWIGNRLIASVRQKSTTDYMEAVVVGNGVISLRASLVKTISALFSISTGASIGREGPLVQLSSLVASWLGGFVIPDTAAATSSRLWRGGGHSQCLHRSALL